MNLLRKQKEINDPCQGSFDGEGELNYSYLFHNGEIMLLNKKFHLRASVG